MITQGRRTFAALAAAAIAWAALPALAQQPQAAEPAEEPVYVHIAVQGDTLIGLSRRLLVEPRRWPEIGRFNRVANPNRIPVGTELRIPLRLMRTEAASASVLNTVGDVRTGGAPLATGQPLGEGNDLVTGADSHVTVRLVDGTVLRLRPASRLLLRESRRVPSANAVQSGARLEQGRVEVEAAPASAGKPGFKIETPQGVLGVRGTEFRVATDGSAGETRGEVLEGVVAFSGKVGTPAPISAGFGSVIGGAGQVAPPVKLLDKPDTAELPTLQERILMRFPLKAMPGAKAYRGQISIDASFDRVVADLTSPTPELRFAELPDGDYILRVRGIADLGLEGQNADLRFKLKARPEAPLPSSPAPKAILIGGKVEFFWTANAQAATYRLQIDTVRPAGQPAAFKGQTLVRDLKDLRELSTVVEGLEPAPYVWRMASVRADGDQGPWGDPREFEIRPPPPVPPPPKVGDRGVSFAWDARPGQTFDFQLARDAEFKQLVLERPLTEPKIDLPLPGTGRFYVRLRARDPDGFIGPWSTPQFFDLPNCLRDSSGACVRAGEQPVILQ